MTDNLKSEIEYIPYKEVVKKERQNIITLINKEAISQKRKDKYKQLPPEDKKKLQEYNKQQFNNQSLERQLQLRQKARKYHKDRFDNIMVRVKQPSMFTRFLFPFYFYVKQCLNLCYLQLKNV